MGGGAGRSAWSGACPPCGDRGGLSWVRCERSLLEPSRPLPLLPSAPYRVPPPVPSSLPRPSRAPPAPSAAWGSPRCRCLGCRALLAPHTGRENLPDQGWVPQLKVRAAEKGEAGGCHRFCHLFCLSRPFSAAAANGIVEMCNSRGAGEVFTCTGGAELLWLFLRHTRVWPPQTAGRPPPIGIPSVFSPGRQKSLGQPGLCRAGLCPRHPVRDGPTGDGSMNAGPAQSPSHNPGSRKQQLLHRPFWENSSDQDKMNDTLFYKAKGGGPRGSILNGMRWWSPHLDHTNPR